MEGLESLHGSTSTTPRVTIISILQELGKEDFQLFKFHLRECKSIPWSQLEDANMMATSDLITQTYPEKALDITMELLKKINRNDLVEMFSHAGPPTKDVRDVAESSSSSLLTASSQPPQQDFLVKPREHADPIISYQATLKTKVEDPFMCVAEGTIPMNDRILFEQCYTRLSLKHVDITVIDLKKAGQDIQLSEIFEHPSGQNIRIRTVLSIGIAGVGKTFLVHKFVSEWAKKNIQHPHLIFVFQFRQLNLLQGQSFRLAQLIHKCINPTKFIPEEALNYIFTTLQSSGNSNYDKSRFKLLFVLDGLDESSLKLNFDKDHDCSDNFTQSILLEELLVNLIKGKLLRGAHIWITTRPAADTLIPPTFVDIEIEVKGFTDNMKEKYIRKRFVDENQAERILSHLKKSSSLYNMCEIPVYCSITAEVMQDMLRTDKEGKLPETLTDIYCRFLLVQTKRKKEKYDATGVNQKEFLKTEKAVLLKLGRMAFEHLQKGNFIFYRKDLENFDLDIKEGPLYSGLCTEIKYFKRDSDCFQESQYCFVHRSIQEFLAAVYLFHCFTERKMQVLETFLDERSFILKQLLAKFDLNSIDDFLKKAMLKALKSENGHLNLFVRFLHGLSLETNQRLLRFLLESENSIQSDREQTENSIQKIQKVISNLKEMNTDDVSPDRITILCLIELKDNSVGKEFRKVPMPNKSSKMETFVNTCIPLVAAGILIILYHVVFKR